MPELPEVETVMRGLSPFLSKAEIVRLDIRSAQLRIPVPQQKLKALRGICILGLERRAKYILVHFANQKTMIVHLGMTGSFTVYPPEKQNDILLDRHDHLVITTDQNIKIIFRDPRRFGMIDVVETDQIADYKSLKHLGPEPLDNLFTAEILKQNLGNRKVPIKVAIMDQKIVVGVGNIYASEALFLAGILPTTPANEITIGKLARLVEKIKFILNAAIESGGSTLRDYRTIGGGSGYFQFHFSVYDREGEPCLVCCRSLKKMKSGSEGIQRIVQAGRSTFFCKTCQK